MRKLTVSLAFALVAITASVAAVVSFSGPSSGEASSHREAPLISEDPTADNTDLYAFRSPDKQDTATIVANFIPAEDPAAGPNYYTFSPSARYNIKLDRNGDGRADVIYRFRFRRLPGPFFLGNTVQPYTVHRVENGVTRLVAWTKTPPNNIGPRTLKTLYGTEDYRALAARRVTALKGPGGGLVFAGQRDDAFFADIGDIFDLLAIRKGLGNEGGGKDFFAGYAVHTISLQLPIAALKDKDGIIGVWSTVERKRVTVSGGRAVTRWVQVSRLGNPLVNEVVIPTPLKDRWNGGMPLSDGQAPFVTHYQNSILATVMNKLYNIGAPTKDRDDLVSVFLTGVPKLNYTGPTKAEMLRVNLNIPVTPADKFSRLGVLGGDVQGFPNGRRLADDVVDISEQAVAGFLKGNKVPLGDGVNADNKPSLGFFPYQADLDSGAANLKGEQKP